MSGYGEDEPEKVKPKVVDQVEEVFEPPQRLEKEIVWKKDGAKMVLISTGSFEMGDAKDKLDIEMKPSWPVHKVELDAFYIDIMVRDGTEKEWDLVCLGEGEWR